MKPTQRYGKIRRLVRENKARVVRRWPYTAQLDHDTPDIAQPATLGIDPGYRYTGLSATTEDKALFEAVAENRIDISKLLATRRELRRSRRSRKTRYRKPRFLGRVRGKGEGWIPPSFRQKLEVHLNLVAKLRKILPVSRIVVEVAAFDIQKIRNPDIQGAEYQQGEQMGFWNVREYVLSRDRHTCRKCRGKSGDAVLNVHHIESGKTGGDAPNNLLTLCETCHKAYHKGETTLKGAARGKSFRESAFMNLTVTIHTPGDSLPGWA